MFLVHDTEGNRPIVLLSVFPKPAICILCATNGVEILVRKPLMLEQPLLSHTSLPTELQL